MSFKNIQNFARKLYLYSNKRSITNECSGFGQKRRNMNTEKFKLPSKLKPAEVNMWIEFSTLARQYKPIMLGQGAPNFPAPDIIVNALKQVTNNNQTSLHQYAPNNGHPRLVNKLSEIYSPLICRQLNPAEEIIIMNGATEALYASLMGFLEEDDEIILIAPFFDTYNVVSEVVGAKIRYIPLKINPKANCDALTSADFIFDFNEMEQLFNEKTKMILLNTPHNPTGKVFTREEIEFIAKLCIKWNVLCISDEVYERLVYPPKEHIRIVTLPGMWERTITICSGSKSFNVTGWRIGWAYGPTNLLKNLRAVHQTNCYSTNSPLQEALAIALESDSDTYFANMRKELEEKRNFTAKFLREANMNVVVPDGGYFMLTNWTGLESRINLENEKDKYRDYKFAKWLVKTHGVQVIPTSGFYDDCNKDLGENYVRVCFIKDQGTLEKGAEILNKI